MAGKRQRAPEPPEALIEELRNGRVVPFIGAGFSKSAQPKSSWTLKTFVGMPTYAELLTRLLDRAQLRNADDEEIVRNYLRRKDSADPEHFDKAAAVLREAMGEVPFYMTLREVLEPYDRNIEGSLAHKFLGRLGFRRIVTVNYDRLLEGFSFPDHEVITPRDEKAFALFMEDTQRNYILKLHGDITRPDTIPWGKVELLRYYGFDSYGNPLSAPPLATQRLRDFLKELFTRETVLFLGTSLATSEGFAQVLVNLVRDWGGSLPRRHFVLVPYDESLASLRSDYERKMNLQYLYYHPDENHTQVWEFISFLKAGRSKPQPQPGEEWEQWYHQKERPEYLLVQLERERTATSVHYLTPKLTNAIATPEFLAADCCDDLEGRYDADVIVRILDAMKQRAANLERRLREERLEARVLFLERELRQSLDPQTPDKARLARAVERYRYLLRLVETTDLEVRVISGLASEDLKRQEASFALLFNRNEAGSFADVTLAYSSQATNDFPEIHMVHINSPEIWRHTFTFEKLWAAARNEEETRALLSTAIEGALGGD
jgi:SIR2-like protein